MIRTIPLTHQPSREASRTSRRSLLQAAVGGAALLYRIAEPALVCGAPREISGGDSTYAEVVRRLRGPMASITIPYNKDFSIDHGSLRAWVDFVCERKAPIIFLTFGDSEIRNLSEQEIEAVMRTVAVQTKNRSLVIGGTPHGWTGQTIDFINRLEDAGVDAVNVHLYTDDATDIMRALAEIAAKTRLPLVAYEETKYSVDLVCQIAKIPGFVGMKCHSELYQYYDFIRETKNDDFQVLSGGQMKQFLFGYLVGSPAYLCPFAPFAPQVSLEFYEALKRNDVTVARKIIFDYEEPLLRITTPLDYPQAYKSALYLAGLYKTNLVRPPLASNAVSDLEPLRTFLKQKHLIGGG